MRYIFAILALCISAPASISGVSVQVIERQAVVTFTTTDGVHCSFGSFTPVIEDINETDFPGSSFDDRAYTKYVQDAGSTSGTTHVMILGSLTSALANDGVTYKSRALENNTSYSGTITCGVSTASVNFTTKTLANGMAIAQAPYSNVATAGTVPYLTMSSFWDRTQRATAELIDPFTGTLMKPLSAVGDETASGNGDSSLGLTFTSATGAAWTTPSNALSYNTSNFASYTGTTGDSTLTCQMTLNGSALIGISHDFVLSQSTSTISFPSSVPNGVDLSWGAPIPTAAQVSNNANFGWGCIKKGSTDKIFLLKTHAEASAYSPAYFRLYIHGNASADGKTVNFNAQVDFGDAANALTYSEGNQAACYRNVIQDNAGTPKNGYLCAVKVNGKAPMIYWIYRDAKTGTVGARFNSVLFIDRAQLNPDFTGATLSAGINADVAWDHSNPCIYVTANNASGHTAILKGCAPASGDASYGTDQAGDRQTTQANGWTWTNLTIEPNYLNAKINTFDSTFVIANYGCKLNNVTADNNIALVCGRGNQNSYSWLVVISNTGTVVGAANETLLGGLGTVPVSWCGEHAQINNDFNFVMDDTHNLDVAGTGQGKYTTALGSPGCVANSTDCDSSGNLLTGSQGDSVQLLLTGEPTGSNPDVNLANAAVNDIFLIGSEYFSIRTKTSATQWTAKRGEYASTPASHANSSTVTMECSMGNLQTQNGGVLLWDYNNDPHGTSTTFTKIDESGPTLTNITGMNSGCSAQQGGHDDVKGASGQQKYRIEVGYKSSPVGSITDVQTCPTLYSSPDSPTLGIGASPTAGGNENQKHPTSVAQFSASTRANDGHDALPFNTAGYQKLLLNLTSISGTLIRARGTKAGTPGPFVIGGTLTSIVVNSSGVATVNTTTGVGTTGGDECVFYGAGPWATPIIYPNVTPGSTNVFTAQTTGISAGTYTNAGLSVICSHLHHEFIPTFAIRNQTLLQDVSGPSSSIGGTSADNDRFCVAHAANECVSGSLALDIYFNTAGANTSATCGAVTGSQQNAANDICLGDNNYLNHTIAEINLSRSEVPASGQNNIRPIVVAPALVRQWTTSASYHPLPDQSADGSCLWGFSVFTRAERADAILVCEPPDAPDDSFNRHDFIPQAITVAPHAGGTNTYIKFGITPTFRCTFNYDDECDVAAATQNSAYPYYFHTPTPDAALIAKQDCTNGCTITIPTLANQITRYTVHYGDGTEVGPTYLAPPAPGVPPSLQLSNIPASVSTGQVFSFTVTALNGNGSTNTGYAGTITFTSSDGSAILPAPSGLTNGTKSFNAQLFTLGNQTITINDSVLAPVTSSNISVGSVIIPALVL